VAALPLPLQDFHLLAFASFAGRTHQYYRLHMGWVDGIDICGLFIETICSSKHVNRFFSNSEKTLFKGTYLPNFYLLSLYNVSVIYINY